MRIKALAMSKLVVVVCRVLSRGGNSECEIRFASYFLTSTESSTGKKKKCSVCVALPIFGVYLWCEPWCGSCLSHPAAGVLVMVLPGNLLKVLSGRRRVTCQCRLRRLINGPTTIHGGEGCNLNTQSHWSATMYDKLL